MLCERCEKECQEVLYDYTPGALFVSRDTGDSFVCVWPAVMGLRKYSECTLFGTGDQGDSHDTNKYEQCSIVSGNECKDYFGCFPEQGEAWLLVPRGEQHYFWTHVDPDLCVMPDD